MKIIKCSIHGRPIKEAEITERKCQNVLLFIKVFRVVASYEIGGKKYSMQTVNKRSVRFPVNSWVHLLILI